LIIGLFSAFYKGLHPEYLIPFYERTGLQQNLPF